jgi:hypothetical protein
MATWPVLETVPKVALALQGKMFAGQLTDWVKAGVAAEP